MQTTIQEPLYKKKSVLPNKSVPRVGRQGYMYNSIIFEIRSQLVSQDKIVILRFKYLRGISLGIPINVIPCSQIKTVSNNLQST